MTIALGFLAGNSQILAADTQMSTDTERVSQGKIWFHATMPDETNGGGIVAITGAGDEFNLRALQSDLSELFSKTRTESMDEFETAMARLIKTFYKDHVAITPDMAQRPEVELIIAARRGTYSRMWVTKRNRISRAHSPVAVGIGAPYAQNLLGDLSLPQQPEISMLLAAYTVFLVKRRNLWVGMDTHVYCLDSSTIAFPRGLGGSDCRKLEEMFRQCIGVNARALHRIFGSGYDFCEAERVSRDIDHLRERFLELFHPSSDTNAESSHT
jgi:hypothetical protein